MRWSKEGFIAIETIIIASLVLLAGGLGVSKFVSAGQSTTKKFNEKYEESYISIGENTTHHCLSGEKGRYIYKGKYYIDGIYYRTETFFETYKGGKYKDSKIYCEYVKEKNDYFWIAI